MCFHSTAWLASDSVVLGTKCGTMRVVSSTSFGVTRAGALAAVVLCGGMAPAHALSGVTILSYMALAVMCGSAFFLYLGMYAPRNGFLLLGNMLCVAANVVFVMMLVEQEGNDTWIVCFAAMALANTYSTLCVIKKYKEQGCGSDSGSDDEGEEGDSEAEGAAEAKRLKAAAGGGDAAAVGSGNKAARKQTARKRRLQRSKAESGAAQ